MKQQELLKTLAQLSQNQRKRLEIWLKDQFNLNEELKNTRPPVCPHCHKESRMIKKGILNNKQRYQCKECGKLFIYDSQTITSYMKIKKDVFYEIVLDTLNGYSLKYTAARLDLPVKTVFFNRHKFLCFLQEYLDRENQSISGTVEIDETFDLASEKGNRKIERKARKRGEPSNLRGISHEQVCIVTTTDRNGHEIFKAVGFGKPTTKDILLHFAKRISNKSVIYSDGSFCYNQLAEASESKLVNLKTHTSYNKVEHLNTVSYIHSLIKRMFAYYKSVATKYINRYLSLIVFLRRFADTDDNEKIPAMIGLSKWFKFRVTYEDTRCYQLFCSV